MIVKKRAHRTCKRCGQRFAVGRGCPDGKNWCTESCERAAKAAAPPRRTPTGKLRGVDPVTSEREYADDEREFLTAMDRYKRENRRPFPTWSEVLGVLKDLGYRRVDS